MAISDIPEPYRSSHQDSSRHYDKIAASDVVGCFYCLNIFPPSDIKRWTDRRNPRTGETTQKTAICPHCSVDSILPTKGTYFGEIPENERIAFLEEMKKHWFSTSGARAELIQLAQSQMEKTQEPYQDYVKGLKVALSEVRWKINHAASGIFGNYNDAYFVGLRELENTLQMYVNQCGKGEKPGLFSEAQNATKPTRNS